MAEGQGDEGGHGMTAAIIIAMLCLAAYAGWRFRRGLASEAADYREFTRSSPDASGRADSRR
jgi:hypothetical protein